MAARWKLLVGPDSSWAREPVRCSEDTSRESIVGMRPKARRESCSYGVDCGFRLKPQEWRLDASFIDSLVDRIVDCLVSNPAVQGQQ